MDNEELQERAAELRTDFENLEMRVLELKHEAELLYNLSGDRELLAYLECLTHARNSLL